MFCSYFENNKMAQQYVTIGNEKKWNFGCRERTFIENKSCQIAVISVYSLCGEADEILIISIHDV
jgi:hypothetical protein